MKIHSINSGFFKLDGGAMFGVVPKSIWNKLNPADENNMCTWAMRCMLVEAGNRLILIDTGIGEKQDQKFFSRFYLHGDDSLVGSLQQIGFSSADITDVFLTHLHFDHCGGAIRLAKNDTGYEPAFKNATYWSNAEHWQWSINPNKRENASFLRENILPIQESGQLQFVEPDGSSTLPFGHFTVNGHTREMMLPVIHNKGYAVVFMADLIPSEAHISLPYIMSYDMFPFITLEEKEKFLQEAVSNDYILFFEHDSKNECCTIQRTEKGYAVKERFRLQDIN